MTEHDSNSIKFLLFFLMVSAVAFFIYHPRHQSSPTRQTVAVCPTTVADRFHQADVVMTGSVFMVVPSGAEATVIIQPQKIYKGRLSQPTVSLKAVVQQQTTGESTAPSTDIHFQSGQQPYLLFLRHLADDTYTTRACDGTRLLGSGLTTEESRVLQGQTAT